MTPTFSAPTVYVVPEALDVASFLAEFDAPGTLFLITPAVRAQVPFTPARGVLESGASSSQELLDASLPARRGITRVVAVGASRVIDRAKYLASRLGATAVAVPSLLSTNAFSTDRSVLTVRGVATSVAAKAPDEAYIMTSLLDLAPRRLHQYGFLDVLSIHTALRDWDLALAAGEATRTVEYHLARAILDAYLALPPESDVPYSESSKLLLHSALVVSMYGDGRPESGTEHIIAKAVESVVGCFHAHSVAFGLLVAMQLQDSWSDEVAARATRIPDWETSHGALVRTQIAERVTSATIAPRPGRYTVLNERSRSDIDRALSSAVRLLRP